LLCVAALAFVFVPSASYTEDRDTILLARTIYALGKNESYQTKLALGSVVMNRVASPWFADDLGDVLRDQQQFPAGSRYDDDREPRYERERGRYDKDWENERGSRDDAGRYGDRGASPPPRYWEKDRDSSRYSGERREEGY
jgi:spore germination cell wall hydrolase CwlJ-like protein